MWGFPSRRSNPFLLSGPALDWLDLEMEANEREDQALEVLDQIVETTQAVRVSGLVDVHQRANLAGGEADVFVSDDDLQLLTANTVRLGPEGVVLGHDLAVLDDPLEFVHHGGVDEGLLPDHGVVLVVAVIGVPGNTDRENYYYQNILNFFNFKILNCISHLSLPSGRNSNSRNS